MRPGSGFHLFCFCFVVFLDQNKSHLLLFSNPQNASHAISYIKTLRQTKLRRGGKGGNGAQDMYVYMYREPICPSQRLFVIYISNKIPTHDSRTNEQMNRTRNLSFFFPPLSSFSLLLRTSAFREGAKGR